MRAGGPFVALALLVLALVAGCDDRDGRCAGLNERDAALCSAPTGEAGS